jgi:hypothetical protein
MKGIRIRHNVHGKAPYERGKLRKHLIKHYGGKCVITGWKNPLEFQMAHIIPKKIGYDIGHLETDSENNCMLLANGLHSMFDGFEWTVDIYSLLDFSIDKEDSFKGFLIMKNPPSPGSSSLATYVDTLVNIPTRYYASLYAHYHTYLKYNYSSWDPKLSFQVCTKDPVFQALSQLTTTSDIKKYLLQLRTSRKNITVIMDDKESCHRVLWNYWSYNYNTWEATSSLPSSVVEEYNDHKEGLTDPEWKPK